MNEELNNLILELTGKNLNINFNLNLTLSWQSDHEGGLFIKYHHEKYSAKVFLKSDQEVRELISLIKSYSADKRYFRYSEFNVNEVEIIQLSLGTSLLKGAGK